jgi:hypothetical protein
MRQVLPVVPAKYNPHYLIAYRSGDTVKGYWKLTSEKEFTAKGIISDFHGVAFVKWTEYNTTTLKNDDLTSYVKLYCFSYVHL